MTDIAVRKSQELSFALIKIAAYIRRPELRQKIEKFAYQILESIALNEFPLALSAITAERNFILLAKNLFELEIHNFQILDRELEALEVELIHHVGASEKVDLRNFFSVKLPVKNQDSAKKEKVSLVSRAPEEVVVEESEIGNEPVVISEANSAEAHYAANEREAKIMEMFNKAESGKMQLRDIIAAFPDMSERTIRYDLKRLADSGKIERQGAGGPSNYYQITSPQSGYPHM